MFQRELRPALSRKKIPSWPVVPILIGLGISLSPHQVVSRTSEVSRALSPVLSSYDLIRMEPAAIERQVRATGELRFRYKETLFDFKLEPHDMRAPDYQAMETGPGGSQRVLPRGPVTTYQGRQSGPEGAQGRFTVTRHRLEGVVFTDEDWYYLEPLQRYLPSAKGAEFVVYRHSDIKSGQGWKCGVSLPGSLQRGVNRVAGRIPAGTATTYLVEVATEADYEYVQLMGGSDQANAEIRSIMNMVDGVYQKELSLRVSITFQNAWATQHDPYDATTLEGLVVELQTYWNANFLAGKTYDLAQIWTGRTTTDGIDGVAWIGAVCTWRTFSYGALRHLSDAPGKPVIAAHEMGHLFSASHPDVSSPLAPGCADTIMVAPRSYTQKLTFCQYSRNEISAYVFNHNSCLTVQVPPPPPPPPPPPSGPPPPRPPPPGPPPPRGPSEPGAPRNLTAVGGIGEVVLRWEAPASDGGTAITDYEYRIDRRPPWTSTGSTDTTHTVSGLVSGATYVFEVRAVNRAGNSRASNRAEAAPKAPDVLEFSHFANGDGATSELVFVNVGTRPVRPRLYFYDTEGSPIGAESVVDIAGDLEVAEDGALTVRTGMEPLGELTVATSGGEALVTGSVRVVSEGPLGGMLRFRLPHVGEAVVKAGTPVRDAIFPVRRRQGGINTGVAIHNLESAEAQVDCELLREGVLLDAVSIALAANGQTSWSIDGAFTAADTTDFAGAVRCDAVGRARFSAIALETDSGSRIFSTLPVMEVPRISSATTTTLNFAHFANGASIVSELVFVNLETRPSRSQFPLGISPTRPVIYFYDPEGSPITPETVVDIVGDLEVTEDGALTVRTEMEPLGELTVSTHGREALVTGSVKVVSEGPIGGMLRFDLPHVGQAVVEASAATSDAIFPVRRREGGINTAVAIHNLDGSSRLVRCELLREGVLLDAVSIPLAANGQTSWSIDGAFTAADTTDFAGSVRCTAVGKGRFNAIALETDSRTRIFTALPVMEVEERMPRE